MPSVLLCVEVLTGIVFAVALVDACMVAFRERNPSALLSLANWPGYFVASGVYAYLAWLMFAWVQLHVPVLSASHVGTWILAFIIEDFCFYWFHRLSHRFGFLWMFHSVHHSGAKYCLSLGFRQSWFPFPALLFYIPLAVAGTPFIVFIMVHAASLLYQALLHFEKIKYPSLITWLLNSPQLHRVHHSSEQVLLDKNFGGVTMLWDHLFRSWHPGNVRTTYGLTGLPEPFTLAGIQFNEILRFVTFVIYRADAFRAGRILLVAGTLPLLLASIALLIWALLNPYWFLGINS